MVSLDPRLSVTPRRAVFTELCSTVCRPLTGVIK